MALTDAFQIVSLSHSGQVRDHNEDSLASRPELGLVILADGMGGHHGGATASNMATTSLVDGLTQAWTPDVLKGLDRDAAKSLSQSILQAQIKTVNGAIFEKSGSDPSLEGMGTTLVACLFYDDFLTVGHLGDSRLYRVRNETLEQVTRDHSLVQEQLDSGMITKEDARVSNNKNFLTRALGIDPNEGAEIHSYDVQADDIFLLCSDGLHGMVTDEDIEMTVVALKANLDLSAQQLIEAANDAGGTDNVSVILLKVIKRFSAKQ